MDTEDQSRRLEDLGIMAGGLARTGGGGRDQEGQRPGGRAQRSDPRLRGQGQAPGRTRRSQRARRRDGPHGGGGPVSADRSGLRPGRGARAGWWPGGRILVVDDQEAVTAVARNMLESAGFSVLTADGGREAVDAFREHADEITVVLLNLTMPNVSGEEAFHEIRRIRQDAKIILTSGYTEPEATAQLADKGLAGFLQKPFHLKTLLHRLREALE